MQVKKVVINNFRNIDHKELVCDASTTIMCAKNMSGKTNTLNAIHWAFTGSNLEGSVDNRANLPINKTDVNEISVRVETDTFSFERKAIMEDGTPTVHLFVDDVECGTVKKGDALIVQKLGLTDIVLSSPKDFNIVKFLLNPLYFDTLAPKTLRKFLYQFAQINFDEICEKQVKAVKELLSSYTNKDPYFLAETLDKDKKAIKKTIDGCKTAKTLFPSISEDADKAIKEQTALLTKVDVNIALVDKYALSVSKSVNEFYKTAMGVAICLLEKGVGEDVYKDVCYPVLPTSNLPFHLGSYAEKTYIGVLFINEFCLRFNVRPLTLLIDNMESLDNNTTKFLNNLGVNYIGAFVKGE